MYCTNRRRPGGRSKVDTGIVLQGILVGLILSAPVGPLSFICIQRSISDGRLHGILSGIGIATADSCYAAVAFLGLTTISGIILSHQEIFRIFAGLVLLAVGIRIVLTRPGCEGEKSPHESFLKDYVSMFAIAIANPLTIIFLMVTLPGFGIVIGGTAIPGAAEFVGGFFSGSAAWWILLCGGIGSLRSRIGPGHLALINRFSGSFIVCIGIAMLLLVVLAVPGIPLP